MLIIPLRISKGVELTGSLGTLKGSVSCHANLIFSFNPKFYSSLVYVLVQLSPLCLTDVILIETDQNSAAVSATKRRTAACWSVDDLLVDEYNYFRRGIKMQSQRGDEGQNVKFVTEVFKNLEMCSLRALRKDDVITFSWL